jgi:anti-sigma-K factor RskA
MAPAPSGKVFELWLQVDGEMVPAGLMPPGEDTQMVLEGDATTATAVGITVEPEGGSPEPTSDPIAVFDFSQAV